MKQFKQLVLFSAIALLSVSGFTACSSSDTALDETTPVAPGTGETVKTQFAINIATPGSTRMSADNTQNANNFLGMENIKLIPMTGVPTTTPAALTAFGGSVINLADIEEGTISSDPSNKTYVDVLIPEGTKNFLFYGTSPMGTDMTNRFAQGFITSSLITDAGTPTNVTDIKNIDFSLSNLYKSGSEGEIGTIKDAFARYLNGVAVVKTWKDYAAEGSNAGSDLTKLYTAFTEAGKVHAGSAVAVLETMQDLYTSIGNVKGNTTIISDIKAAILGEITAGQKKAKMEDPDDAGVLKYTDVSADEIKNFPTKQGLPEGVVLYSYSDNEFAYKKPSTIGSNPSIELSTITYPAPITYFVSTPAKASKVSEVNWPTTTNAWNEFWTPGHDGSNWENEVVKGTQLVALEKNINYGVAALQTSVICKYAHLEDNGQIGSDSKAVTQVEVPTDGFEITGILVGGQPAKVNWQFVDEFNSNNTRTSVVYDSKMNDGMTAKFVNSGEFTEAKKNYTLLFDNWIKLDENQAQQDNVNIAVEFINNSQTDFYGVDGIVAKGQKFYLLAKLDPARAKESDFTISNYIPKHESNDKRVFIQDYTTTANLTITSLKKAYVTIPDLRSSKLQLGLSVNLEWQSGLTFTEDL